MKTNKMLAAVIAAAAVTATVSSMAPAFAYDDIAAAEAALINSYSNPNAQDIAAYLLDNGMSLDEAKEIVDGYEERHPVNGMARSVTVDTVVDGPYHNSDHLSAADHYVVAIVKNTSAALDERIILDFESAYAGYDDEYYVCGGYADITNKSFIVSTPQTNRVVTLLYTTSTLTTPSMDAVMRYKVYTVGAENERNLIDHILFTHDYGSNSIDYDTYALGDVNHDGYVDENDSDVLVEYLTLARDDFSFTYTDQSTNVKTSYAHITNALAADMNEDGDITMVDLTRLNQWRNINNNDRND